MKTVRAKFNCLSVKKRTWDSEAELSAVYGNEGDNQDFTTATPSGNLTITISKDVPASGFFEPGKSYFLDFTEAPELDDVKAGSGA